METKIKMQPMSDEDHKKMLSTGGTNLVLEPFGILTTTLLGLLLPLSFLHLARLSHERYLFTFSTTTFPYPSPPPQLLIPSYLFHLANSALLHVLVSLVTLSALMHAFTGTRNTPTNESSEPLLGTPKFNLLILLLCALHVCVDLVFEAGFESSVDRAAAAPGYERTLLTRFLFFLGLHGTMLHWVRIVVKPLVRDHSVFGHGVVGEERWIERVAIGASFGGFWWWRLRGEAESLVVVAEITNEVLGGVGVADFVAWWLYYINQCIGMIRVVKGLVWIATTLIHRRATQGNPCEGQRIDDVV